MQDKDGKSVGRPPGSTLWGVPCVSKGISGPMEFFNEWPKQDFKEEVRLILIRRGKLKDSSDAL